MQSMIIQERGRIKDLLLRKRPDGSPMLTTEEANKFYAKGLNRLSVVAFQVDVQEEPEKEKKRAP
jgi:hypothetical protein